MRLCFSGSFWRGYYQDSCRCQDSRVQALRKSKLFCWSELYSFKQAPPHPPKKNKIKKQNKTRKQTTLIFLMWLCPYQCIETDETARKPDQIKMPLSSEEERDAITHLEQAIATDRVTPGMQILNISFFFFFTSEGDTSWLTNWKRESWSVTFVINDWSVSCKLCRTVTDESTSVWKGWW